MKKIKKAKSKKAIKKKTIKKVKPKKAIKKTIKKTTKAGKKSVPKKKASLLEKFSLEEVGVITHYFSHVEAAVIKITRGTLTVGDTVIMKGHTTEFKEKIKSMQLYHESIEKAKVGDEIGIKVSKRVREHDKVYKILESA